jgi:hypothetical protein
VEHVSKSMKGGCRSLLTREALAEILDSSCLLLLANLLVLLLIGSSLQALPG